MRQVFVHEKTGVQLDGIFIAASANDGAHAANGLTTMFVACGRNVADIAKSHAGTVYNQLLDNGDHY